MTLAAYEVDIDGLLTIGPTTSYRLTALDGLRSLPDIREGDVLRANADGAFAGNDYLGTRTVLMELIVFGSSADDLGAKVRALKTACRPASGRDEFPVRFQVPGEDAQLFFARCRDVRMAMLVSDEAARIARVRVRFDATDPRIYSDAELALVTGLSATSSGLTFDAVFPLSFGGVAASGVVQATNDGDYPAPWVATIAGPVNVPRVEHVGQGRTVEVNLDLLAGQTLVLDSLNRAVLLDGSASRYNLLLSSKWFTLEPGSNDIRFAGASGSGSMTFTYRHAWI